MKIGYARVSTAEQQASFEAQQRELEALGCEKVFAEERSSVKERPALEAMLDFLRQGDEVLALRVDRLARSVRDLLDIVERIRGKGAAVEIGGLGRINGDPTSALILNVLGAIAQFEREIMLARQRVGIEAAKAGGKYRGRKPGSGHGERIRRMAAAGMNQSAIARELGIERSTVWRALRHH